MEHFFELLQSHFPWVIEYRYVLILVGASIESLNTIILAGFLTSIGATAFLPTVLICLLGDFLNGYMWYYVGYFGGSKPIDKWGRKDPKARSIIELVERHFHRHSAKAIIFAKLTWSLTIATLVTAGSFKYNLKRFSVLNFFGAAGWVAIVFSIGYVFGHGLKSFDIVNNIVSASLFLAGAIVLVYLLKNFFKSKYIKSLRAGEKLREIGDRLRDAIDKMLS
jgi:membrane protein DedA with SNARE-associated domain